MKSALAFVLLLAGVFLLASVASIASPQDSAPAPNAPTSNGPPRDPVIVSIEKARDEGRMADAEKLALDAVHQAEQADPHSPQLASYLEMLASLLVDKDRNSEALALDQRALEINQSAFGPQDKSVVEDLVAIGSLLSGQGKNDDGERTLKQALDITRLNPDIPLFERNFVFVDLSHIYMREERWPEAEQLLLDATQGCANSRKVDNDCSYFLRELSEVYQSEGRQAEADQLHISESGWPAEVASLDLQATRSFQNRAYPEAEDAVRRVIAWIEQNPEYKSRLAFRFGELGSVLAREGRYDDAESAFVKEIDLQLEDASGPDRNVDHPSFDFDSILYDELIDACSAANHLSDAEPIIQHALEVEEKLLGAQDSNVARTLVALANVYQAEGEGDKTKYDQALALYGRALDIQQTNLGADHPDLADVLRLYTDLLRKMHQDAKAAEVQARIDALEKKR